MLLAHTLRGFAVAGTLTVAVLFSLSPEPTVQNVSSSEGPVSVSQETSRRAAVRRRALLVGIDTYETSGPLPASAQGRGFRNLHGAAADARDLAEILIEEFDFPREEVVVLTDHAATREAILKHFQTLLVAPAQPGDHVVFYFAGHGSLVHNPSSDEPDHLDESLVPVDASRGAPDLRDKEIRRLLNQILDRQARPTVILDSCYSGSATRGLPTSAEPRALLPANDSQRDPGPYGPSPEERGALILAAAQGDEFAWETEDEDGLAHGAFSWALLRSLRDLRAGEPAEETFLRVRARLHAELRRQEPVLEGSAEVRAHPLFGAEATRTTARAVVAIERLDLEGFAIVQGGWAHGLAVGGRLTYRPSEGEPEELEIVQLLGATRAKARRQIPTRDGTKPRPPLPSGTLLEITGWAAPQGRRLAVSIPSWPDDLESLRQLARELARQTETKISWVSDPTVDSPTHVLRWNGSAWELVVSGSGSAALAAGPEPRDLLKKLPRPSRLFVDLPLPATLAGQFEIGPGTPNDGLVLTNDPRSSALQLAGRWVDGQLEYSWIRPDSRASEDPSGLPASTPWRVANEADGVGESLRRDLFHLRKIHGWLALESPARGDFAYELELAPPNHLAPPRNQKTLRQGEQYQLTMQLRRGFPADQIRPRHLYVFTIDSLGNSKLLFGLKSDMNRLPIRLANVPNVPNAPNEPTERNESGFPTRVLLGDEPLLRVVPPFGRDSYFLLTTDEPLANPWILDYDGFRPRGPRGDSPLEELLSLTGGTSRSSERVVTPVGWSIERRSFLSVASEPSTP